jgi:aminopeptidase N
MKFRSLIVFGLLAATLYSCRTSKNGKADSSVMLDTVTVAPQDVRDYKASATKYFDLIHTRLEVSFDWEKQYMYGKANIRLAPWFFPQNELTLDAKGMEIKKLGLIDNNGFTPLTYTYDSAQLFITLPKYYTRKDTFEIFVDYIAKPNELAEGGSAAITSDKGLYFINPLGKEPGKPKQIWTQGETEANSAWFPTIDKPNQKMTEEIYMTVPDSMVTLSNGLLISSTKNADGTRTDYWKQSLPHAPYLVMMTVGKFTIIKDTWRNMPVEYYVEDSYVPYAKDIFGNTPEMLEYFSTVLKYPYAWEKYSQVSVYDYVSGAMENTTANLYFHELLRTTKELKDRNFEYIIAHELFHQWFGDLLTTESWSNLTLNEGFADYSEYLWIDHKYGRYEAEQHRKESTDGYFQEAQTKQEPLIRYYVEDREAMFDAHSYNKGGMVLHMLRDYLGDDAFFTGLSVYLKDNQFQPVEHNNLRLAFEKVTGEDLNWFFNQWYLSPGHPELNISYDYVDSLKTETVTIEQKPSKMKGLVYRLPLKVDIYAGGKVMHDSIVIDQPRQLFTFKVATKPQLVNVDATKNLLAVKTDNKTLEEFVFQYNNAPLYLDKIEALDYLLEHQDEEAARTTLLKGFDDKFWGIRQYVADNIDSTGPDDFTSKLRASFIRLARQDENSNTAAAALFRLNETKSKEYIGLYTDIIKANRSYLLTATALDALNNVDKDAAYALAKTFNEEHIQEISTGVSSIYAEKGNPEDQQYFEKMIPRTNSYGKYSVLAAYAEYLTKVDIKTARKGVPTLKLYAEVGEPWWIRYAGGKGIYNLSKEYDTRMTKLKGDNSGTAATKAADLEEMNAFKTELDELFKTIKAQEKGKDALNRYKNLK